jgi:ABC-type antimicrobial peptide transport system permease subunit
VGLLSFTRYAIASVLRSRRRSLFAIVGIVLSLSLVSGSWIAVDSSGIGVLRAALGQYRVDFVASATNGYVPFEEITESSTGKAVDLMKSVEDVTSAAPFATIYGWQYANASSKEVYSDDYMYNSGSLAFLSRNSTPLLDAYAVDGELPDNGTVAIPNAVAQQLNISLGDPLTLSFIIYGGGYYDPITSTYIQNNTYINLSFPVSQIWTQDPDAQPYSYYFDYMGIANDGDNVIFGGLQNPAVMNLVDLPQIMNAPNMSSYASPYLSYDIWIDRDSVISLGDLAGSVDRLQFIERQLNKKGFSEGFVVQENVLLNPIMQVAPNLEMLKLLFLALSSPVMGLGVYLSIVGVDLGVTERRREFGILKSRGASNRQVRTSLLIEAVILGAFAGVLGLLIGFGVSRPLLDSASTLFVDSDSESFGTDFMISPWTVVLSIMLGTGLMLLSSYRPYKRASRAEVSESLHLYAASATQVQYKLRWDIVFLILSALSVFSVWIGIDALSNMETSWMVQLIVIALVVVGIVLFPLMPLFLTLGVIRPLTRGTKKLYSKFTLIVRPWTKDLHYLVDRNIVRNPRRASNLCVIISLALAFGIFISVTMESNLAFEEDRIRAEIGSDVKVEGRRYSNYGPVDTDPSGLDSIWSIEGVDSVALSTEFYTYVTVYSYAYLNAGISLIDPDDYAETVRPGGFYFTDGGSEMLDELKTNGTALLENYWHEEYDVLVGDVLNVRIQWSYYDGYNYTSFEDNVPVLVAGFVKPLPGISSYSNMVYMDRASWSFFDEENLTRMYASTNALIDVGKGVDQDAIGDEAVEIFEDAGFGASYRTKAGELEQLNEDPFYGALSDFLYLEYLFSGTIMTVGVGLLIFVAVADREKELASIMARGSTGGQIRKILMGESITLMALGLVVGISVGLLSSYLFNTLLTTGMYGEVERRMVFSWVSGIVVVASVAALLIASLIATSRAGRIKLAEVLRIRGG